ncbi:hypothetical protein Sya03_15960 [Spirilliplanes yamanashiensis]|uniref:Uncharacterized protein n=1 Tax=Spirilliplanes yamanashiensis TaxID=42233 RepID=A0A8J3Y6E6_9ACTN|nr:hypothetical protein Sya03_15960 [Spirilliplanes yamanashiensis]
MLLAKKVTTPSVLIPVGSAASTLDCASVLAMSSVAITGKPPGCAGDLERAPLSYLNPSAIFRLLNDAQVRSVRAVLSTNKLPDSLPKVHA